ncbi:MAG: elongation factor Ts [SAR86 cluster bacterium]|uniref:Elongation factor Ts n=1 Tax=SAR86 cluster bacterium TaxID=2030880 RepID=A0A937HZC5_9GAMM|nr:elongation factor Ts [SAR86 cluster bacterium]
MTIKAQDVKELREKTGLGMMECKKALEQANGNIDDAIKNLRKSSALKAEKKASRTAVEGIITSNISKKEIIFVEVNCETDFVAKDENFINFCEETLKVAVEASSEDNLLNVVSENMEKQRMSLVQKIGENIIIRKVKKITGEVLESYIHSNKKIAAGVSLEQGSPEIAKEVAIHIAATNPIVLSPEDLDESYINSEREIFRSQVEKENKPEEIKEKMIQGKLNKQLADVSLLKQAFVKDPSKTVEAFLSESNAKISSFIRIEVGEGIEVEKKDFAEEVQSQLKS